MDHRWTSDLLLKLHPCPPSLYLTPQHYVYHLSALDIVQYKMITLLYTGVHPVKLNQMRPILVF